MTSKQLLRIRDYLSGIKELKGISGYPVGVILINKKDQREVLDTIKAADIAVIEMKDRHPDTVLRKMADHIGAGKGCAVDVQEEIAGRVLAQLNNIASGSFYAFLAGEEKPRVLNPLPPSGFILLVVDDGLYGNLTLSDIPSSFCDLASN